MSQGSSGSDPVRVAAAVIERDGRILIGQRRAKDAYHPLKWEFPGGKLEPGEEAREALSRELREELAIEAEIGEELARYRHFYRERGTVELFFYRVTQFRGEPRNLNFEQLLWESPERLPGYDFLEADIAFARELHLKGEGRGLAGS